MRGNSSGQVLLITLLILTVAMTIGLSLVGRTRTNVNLGNDVAESAQAFSAAEAGIEAALKTGSAPQGVQTLSGTNISYNTTVSSIGAAAGAYPFPQRTALEDVQTLWFVNHNVDQSLNEVVTYTGPTIDVCWKGAVSIPAVGVIIYYKRAGTYMDTSIAFDPNNVRNAVNHFSPGGGLTNGCGQSNVYVQTINFAALGINPVSDVLLMMRIRPYYDAADLFVNSNTPLPSQGNTISSTGTTGTGVNRKVLVLQQYRTPPAIFDDAIVSQASFAH